LDLSFLHETQDGAPNERLLQLVWQHQRLRTGSLALADGRVVEVLHPGFWNHARGPDFRDAVIRFGTDPLVRGDVEIDLRVGDWVGHRHRGNPDYGRVILHAVWHPAHDSAHGLPVLVLRNLLDASLTEIMTWVDLDPGLPDNVIGRCASGLARLPEQTLADLLQQAALFRFQCKAMELGARARQVGWEQALWEGLCAGLGYQHNVWPMRRLAERGRQSREGRGEVEVAQVQARLLGMAGLLPHESRGARSGGAVYLRQLWDLWWRERDGLDRISLPRSLWRLSGVRPANHPQRRVALAAHWLMSDDLVWRLEQWLSESRSDRQLVGSLLTVLQAGADPFWDRHWTLTSAPMRKPQPLLGGARLSDLAENVVLPWFWVRAEAGRNAAVQEEVVRRYLAWPAAQDNAVLRLARMRLFAGEPKRLRWSAALQQGLMQIVRDFCGHSNALCDNCVLPERLRVASFP
jgi:hypothetical protein